MLASQILSNLTCKSIFSKQYESCTNTNKLKLKNSICGSHHTPQYFVLHMSLTYGSPLPTQYTTICSIPMHHN